MSGYEFVINQSSPGTGGNIWQGDPWTFAPKTWQHIIDRFSVRSVLDLGSGRGFSAAWFHKAGCQTVAMDGEIINVKTAVHPTVHHNLEAGPFVCPVDLVHCQEVVEHIEEKYLNNLLNTLANGQFILMTHAEPDQPGYNHVNCQTSNYWVKQLDKYGYNFLEADSKMVRYVAASESAHHLARSGLVFGRRIIYDTIHVSL